MVKNTQGGGKAKGLARKNNKIDYNKKLRLSECDAEKYAIVRKNMGGDICEVICDDHIIRYAIIRGKFNAGKGKRQNMITSSCLVLVGLREWASTNTDKKEKCDILEVYNPIEVDQIKLHPKFPIDFMLQALQGIVGTNAKESSSDGFGFSSISEQNLDEIDDAKIREKTEQFIVDNGEAISLDDI